MAGKTFLAIKKQGVEFFRIFVASQNINTMKHSHVTHRMGTTFLAALTLIIIFSSFGGDSHTQRFKDAIMSLDNTIHTLTAEFDYWPECGIRVTGSHLASLISLTDLQKMLPCPLYVSGPHHDGLWDLDNEYEYGHYNPEAIEWLTGVAQKVVSDKNFVRTSKPLIDSYLYRQMHIMMVVHDALYNDCSKELREKVFNSSLEANGESYETDWSVFALDRLKLEDGTYVYGNIDYRFLHFWARRWEDGTISQFYQGLSTIFKAYHPEYEYSRESYWKTEEEWRGEEWYGEGEYSEMYVVIDGSDLRLRLGPSTSADTFKWGDGSNRHPKVGERFLYLGEEGDFYQINFHGNTLWVSKKYTHLEE